MKAAVLLAMAAAGAAFAGVDEGRVKAETCTACHGVGGNSTTPEVPSLAAQPRQSIVSALFQFREGKRTSPVMSPLTAKLTNADLNDLAAYFSAQAPAAPSATAADAVKDAGRRLTTQQNCVACHAANLMGQQHIPRLAGQQAEYLRVQLLAFKSSMRADMDGTMTSAAQALSAEDIELLSKYLAALEPNR